MIQALIQGILIGILTSIPVGPVSILSVHRTIQHGYRAGLCTGLGASISDVLYSSLALIGLSYFSEYVSLYKIELQLITAVILIFIAYKVFNYKPNTHFRDNVDSRKLLKDTISGFLVTVSNPINILLFGGIFTTFTFINLENIFEILILLFGILAGSLLWWYVLSLGIDHIKKHFTDLFLIRINHITGYILIAIALYLVVKTFLSFV